MKNILINNAIFDIFQPKQQETTIDVISTGSLSIDFATGTGGIPRGSIVEVFGPPSTGKTTILMHIIAEAQKHDNIVMYLDVDHDFDIVFASTFKIKLDELFVTQPNDLEDLIKTVQALANSREIDVIVVNSIAGVAFDEDTIANTDDQGAMGQFLRKLLEIVKRTGAIVIFTSQLRKSKNKFRKFRTITTGGNALELYSTLRLHTKKVCNIKDLDDTVGERIEVSVIKNKTKEFKKKVELDILYGAGIRYEREVLDMCLLLSIIIKTGSWYYYKDLKLGQGIDKVMEFLRENTQTTLELVSLIKSKIIE
jgi:recombination protein RecA